MKDFVFDRNNKKVKFNIYLNFITVFLVFIFYLIPVFPAFEGPPLSFLFIFVIYFALFSKGLHFVQYQILYAIFVAGFVGFILLFIYSYKFKQGRIINKARKYIIYLFMQVPFSIGLLYFGIDNYIDGTHYVVDRPIQPPGVHYPYNMILAILIIAITLFQIFHFYFILRKNLKLNH